MDVACYVFQILTTLEVVFEYAYEKDILKLIKFYISNYYLVQS